MRIGIDASCLQGNRYGVGRCLFSILKEWSIMAPQNKYILYTDSALPEEDVFKNDCFVARVLEKPWLLLSKGPLWNSYCIPRELFLNKVDLFFSPSYTLPFVLNTISAVNIYDISFEKFPEASTPQRRLYVKRAATKADAVITGSEYSRREILNCYKLPEDKVHRIYLAADEKFRPMNDETKIREIKNRFKIKNRFIFYCGAIYKRRNLPNLIKAFRNLPVDILKEYQFLMLGEVSRSSLDMDLCGLIETANLQIGEGRLLHIDYVDEEDLVWLYNAAELFIYPSLYEGFGLPVLEAMACGTPVVTSDRAAIPEVVGDAAVKVDPDNVELMREAVLKVINDGELRERLANEGPKRARMFSWSKCASETLELFYKLTSEKKRFQ